MSRFYFSILAMIWVSSISYAQVVYTWIDGNGIRHFSDTPKVEKAEAIELPEQAPSNPAKPLTDALEKHELPPQIALPLKTKTAPIVVEISQPLDDSSIRSNSGSLEISATLSRKLMVGEQLQLVKNNVRYGAPTTLPNWQLRHLDRGTHSFNIQIVRDGKLIASSHPITVHVLRATINSVKQQPNP